MKRYYSYLVKKVIHIKKLLAVDYLHITSNYCFEEEGHFFYEFAYVDSGSAICVVSGTNKVELNQGDFFLIKPDVAHHYEYNGNDHTNLFIVCFESSADLLELIEGKRTLSPSEREIMSTIFSESRKAFKFPREKKLALLEKPAFGAQQLVENHVESLLINMVRAKLNDKPEIKFVMNSTDFNNKLVNDIIQILKTNLYGKITLEEIQNSLFYSKTYLNNNFKKITGDSIMHYYRVIKIEEAKKLIKNGESITTISDKLFFESPNYFSKVFRSVTGLTPSKYKRTIV